MSIFIELLGDELVDAPVEDELDVDVVVVMVVVVSLFLPA
jgi:hypothetical protein